MSTQRPHDLAFTLFGEFLLHRDAPVGTASLIELFRPLGLTPAATRTALSRMTRRGWLEAGRRGRRSFYAPTARARKLLAEGAARIHAAPATRAWDGLWYLLAYSIPESRRQLRDRLRLRLQWLGFGQLGNGLWISPHHLRGEVNDLAAELGIADHLELFRAQYQGYGSVGRLVAQAWDLERVNRRYADFIARHGAGGAESTSPADAYLRRFRLVHEYRGFPLLDPGLPERLLPAHWKGGEAAALFRRCHDRLRAPADAFVAAIVDPEPAAAEPPSARAG